MRHYSLKDKSDTVDFLENESACFKKGSVKNERSYRLGENVMYLTRDLNLDYIKNFPSSTFKEKKSN